MPIGIDRLNARHQQPNSRITFIKPLPGDTSRYAQDFLERIAAICHPIMKSNHISVMSLEEYEPNPEFAGRNFNAGEVIQLVLRARGTGQWLSFRSVQMVMMHELAHCMQMNHSKAFWAVRNQYAGELRQLWQKGYTGDGFWGRGKTVLSYQYETNRAPQPELLPSNLCGGTYRTWQGRKRKRRSGHTPISELSYKEKQQRRIAKKFGTNGVALGDDEEIRVMLEDGRRQKAKPRVASSVRGRELRAAAALARFDGKKEETTKGHANKSSSDEDDLESGDDMESAPMSATDLNGIKLLDSKGNPMVQVCSDGNQEDSDVKQEMQELQDLELSLLLPESADLDQDDEDDSHSAEYVPSAQRGADKAGDDRSEVCCPICTMRNKPSSVCCEACSHVLQTENTSGAWQCVKGSCSKVAFVNSGDAPICGLCGAQRETDRRSSSPSNEMIITEM